MARSGVRRHTGAALITLFSSEFDSSLDEGAVIERIRGLVRPQPSFGQALREGFGWRAPGTPPFIGEVRDRTFLIRRDIRYRNSFLPRIRGAIRSSPGGARIRLDMQLQPAVLAFVLLWLGSAAAVAVSILDAHAPEAAVLPVAMLAFGLGLTALGFYPEARKATRMLRLALARQNQPLPGVPTVGQEGAA